MSWIPDAQAGDFYSASAFQRPYHVARDERTYAAGGLALNRPTIAELVGQHAKLGFWSVPQVGGWLDMDELASQGITAGSLSGASGTSLWFSDGVGSTILARAGWAGENALKRRRPLEFASLASTAVVIGPEETRPAVSGDVARNLTDGRVYERAGSDWVAAFDEMPDFEEVEGPPYPGDYLTADIFNHDRDLMALCLGFLHSGTAIRVLTDEETGEPTYVGHDIWLDSRHFINESGEYGFEDNAWATSPWMPGDVDFSWTPPIPSLTEEVYGAAMDYTESASTELPDPRGLLGAYMSQSWGAMAHGVVSWETSYGGYQGMFRNPYGPAYEPFVNHVALVRGYAGTSKSTPCALWFGANGDDILTSDLIPGPTSALARRSLLYARGVPIPAAIGPFAWHAGGTGLSPGNYSILRSVVTNRAMADGGTLGSVSVPFPDMPAMDVPPFSSYGQVEAYQGFSAAFGPIIDRFDVGGGFEFVPG